MLKFKYTIIYTSVCILLFILLVKWVVYLTNQHFIKRCNNYLPRIGFKEGYSNYEYKNLIDYQDPSSPLYSHNVDLPINNPLNCSNFCGPKSQCAITKTQCTSDVDCYGCQPINKKKSTCLTEEVPGFEDSGKLSQNQGLHYSILTSKNLNIYAEVYPGSNKNNLHRNYEGVDLWTPSFNYGLKLYNIKQTNMNTPKLKEKHFLPNYPETVTATGLFYNTGPSASNTNFFDL
jgi:hypothetical protein